ncbi:TIGR02677 family protein [Sporosarcina sp. FSL W8-0480]|uniref:TIGR02677 family protein n=1 Tax=Sporosarcina sp. FSL W8-0480 TaxID=2954701 RepID=UPI0030DB63A4
MNKYEFDSVYVFKYISEPNSYIYRPIMRFLYEKHMGLEHHSVMADEIYQMLLENGIVDDDFTELDLQDSLSQLEKWENIASDKVRRKGITIEEFKRKRYTYQITDVGVEVEELLIRLDELDEQLIGGMKSRQFSLLLRNLELLRDTAPRYLSSSEKVNEIWMGVFETYKALRIDASNYLYHIQKAEKENLFNTELFLEFKDNIIHFLSSYISELNKTKHKINKVIGEISSAHIEEYIDVIIQENRANALLYDNYSPERMRASLLSKWKELNSWFLGGGGNMSDIDVLSERTNEAITMIVSYANRLSESMSNSQSRIVDYRTLASWFKSCQSLDGASQLFAAVLGVTHSRSLYAKDEIHINHDGKYVDADDIWITNTDNFIIPNMGNRGPRGKTQATSIKNNRIEQQRRIRAKIEQRKLEEESVKDLIRNGKIILEEVGELTPFQRRTILKWIRKTTKQRVRGQERNKLFRTETGLRMRIRYREEKKQIEIKCKDGILKGPNIEIVFEEDSL